MGFDATQIANENQNGYSTLCFESSANAMEDYTNCDVQNTLKVDESENKSMRIFPNPTNAFIQLSNANDYLGASFKLSTLLGDQVLQGTLQSENTTLNLGNLPDGIYFLSIEKGHRTTFKIVKQ
jgi:hypothetical protein